MISQFSSSFYNSARSSSAGAAALAAMLLLGLTLVSGCAKPHGLAADSGQPTASAAAPSFNQTNGKAVFTRVCAVCHQLTGAGVPGAFPPLAGSEIAAAMDPAIPIKIVLLGLQGPITVSGKAFNSVMPPQGAMLSDKDIADALSYARTSWGNSAPAVSENAVKSMRGSLTRTTMWTWAELKQP